MLSLYAGRLFSSTNSFLALFGCRVYKMLASSLRIQTEQCSSFDEIAKLQYCWGNKLLEFPLSHNARDSRIVVPRLFQKFSLPLWRRERERERNLHHDKTLRPFASLLAAKQYSWNTYFCSKEVRLVRSFPKLETTRSCVLQAWKNSCFCLLELTSKA